MLGASLAGPLAIFATAAVLDRHQTLASVERDLLSTLDTLHGHAENLLQFQELAVGAAEELLRGVPDTQIRADPHAQHLRLRSLTERAGRSFGLVVFDAEGRPLVESDRPVPPPGIDVSDRPYFLHHRAVAGSAARLSGIMQSRNDGSPVFFLTIRRSAPDGSFRGVVAVGIRQRTIAEFWSDASPNPNSLVSLLRDDLTVLARHPALEFGSDRVPPNAPLARAIATGRERSPVRGMSPLDGVDRVFAYRRIERFGAVVIHGISRDSALGGWRRRLPFYVGSGLAVAAALFALVLLAKLRQRDLHNLAQTLEHRVEQRTSEIQASEARVRLLAREVDHRAKNALAVVQATLKLTPKRDANAYAKAVEGRVSALARAQTLLSDDHWRGASLRALLVAELEGFANPDGGGPKTDLSGPSVTLPPLAAQPVAMAVHELATNAVKHGALSVPDGRVAISWSLSDGLGGRDDLLTIHWTETGGPRLGGPPERRGFGRRLLDSVVRGQLGGKLVMDWAEAGLTCELVIPMSRLSASALPEVTQSSIEARSP